MDTLRLLRFAGAHAKLFRALGQNATPVLSLLRFVGAYVKANFQIALEYRVSFWVQVFAMILNDAMWLTFWGLFFQRFPAVRDYGFHDVIMLWAVVTFSFGLAVGVFGNAWRYATLVAQGGLDFYLVLPRPVLLHVIVSSMSVSGWGDVLFGLALYVVLVRPSPTTLLLFLALSLASTAIFVSYAIVANALAFWLGNAEGFVSQVLNAMLVFSTYPSSLFTGAVKVLLYTAVPAGFVVYVPVALLRAWSWPLALGLAGATCLSLLVANAVFALGLRRYESGSLLALRS